MNTHQTRNMLLNVVFGILAMYLAVSLFTTVRHNYDLQKQISDLEKSNQELEQSNQNLQYQIAYFNTESFKDKEARAKLGLQAPGESVIILPKKAPVAVAAKKAKPPKSNWQQWMDFLRGAQS